MSISKASILEFLRDSVEIVKNSEYHFIDRKLTYDLARDSLFLEQLGGILDKSLKDIKQLKVKCYKCRNKTKNRTLNAVFSDWHLQSHLTKKEVPYKFGPVEEARSIAKLCYEMAEYKSNYRDNTDLIIHLLGDMIQGLIHDMRDGAPLTEQVAAAIRILIQAVTFFAANFPKVTIFCTPGNHGRNISRHPQRAVQQKWDSIETIIYTALKEATKHISNVTVKIFYTPYYDYRLFDFMGFATHGDTVLKCGNPGSSINIRSIKNQINEINAAVFKKHKKHYSVFIEGHVHTASIVYLPNGVCFISNGCVTPPDHFATSIGILEQTRGQWIFESTPKYMVGDQRLIMVDESTDKDSSFDSIISPFKGL